MARAQTMSQYLATLTEHEVDGINLETRVLEVNHDNVLVRPEITVGGQVLWSGEPQWVEVGCSLGVNVFTMNDQHYLTSVMPIYLGEHHDKDEEMQ